MTLQEDIKAVEKRLARAEMDRDAWRTAGREEKYLEAYFMVEALELHLQQLRQPGR